MKKINIVLIFVLTLFLYACNSKKKQKSTDTKLSPEETSGVYDPNMKEFYFSRQRKGEAPKTYTIQYKNGEWKEPIIENRMMDGFISPDGNTMYLGHQYMERTASGWSEKKSLGPQFEEIPIMRLTVSKAHTYVLDERDSIGTIRYSRLIDDEREEPKAFGKEINVGKWTAHPFIAPDESYLIWDSERAGGYGETDLYISFRQKDDSWGSAINMGEDINTEYEDGGGIVTTDGKYFFFNTINLGENYNESQADIFWVSAEVINKLRIIDREK